MLLESLHHTRCVQKRQSALSHPEAVRIGPGEASDRPWKSSKKLREKFRGVPPPGFLKSWLLKPGQRLLESSPFFGQVSIAAFSNGVCGLGLVSCTSLQTIQGAFHLWLQTARFLEFSGARSLFLAGAAPFELSEPFVVFSQRVQKTAPHSRKGKYCLEHVFGTFRLAGPGAPEPSWDRSLT